MCFCEVGLSCWYFAPTFFLLCCCLAASRQSTSKADDVCNAANAQWNPLQTQPLAEKHHERGTELGRSGHTWASTAKGMRYSGAAGLKHLTASQAVDEDKFLTFLQTCGFWLKLKMNVLVCQGMRNLRNTNRIPKVLQGNRADSVSCLT